MDRFILGLISLHLMTFNVLAGVIVTPTLIGETYIQPDLSSIRKIPIENPNYSNLGFYILNVDKSPSSALKNINFHDPHTKEVLINSELIKKMEILPPGYVSLAGKINTPPGYSVTNEEKNDEKYFNYFIA
ncbi:uncharacterized protein LOC127289806 [Leptopilina boulardi]|uniref:uncharacterized protein LOC127289806 n=1 Tax=Leptopilina boulardi TaxID=63433 RepID=UPI0021F53B22|nr:uncharacterized protein LOC127289806 [Leptopilina boulardi]